MEKQLVKDAKPVEQMFRSPPPLKQSEQLNISIIIDTYDDIFSDFDPRPYHERALSEDFLLEVRRRHVPHKKGGLEVRFLIPDQLRDQKTEGTIKRRLKYYFKDEEKELQKHISGRRRRGVVYIAFGATLLLAITFATFTIQDNMLVKVVELLLAPAGWFGMWEGIGRVVEKEEGFESQRDLYKQLAESVYTFIPESEALKGSIFTEAEPFAKEVAKEAIREVIEEAKSPIKLDPIKKILKEAIKGEMK
ncbi:MAG: hypothetical protein V1909_01305 [Candidatus Micrarchaeota archaeon]